MPRLSPSSKRRYSGPRSGRGDEAQAMQAEEARCVLQEQVDQQANELSSRSHKVSKERKELANLRFRCKEYAEKVESY
eukprot:2293264-Pleurochrysis_carterae.AAC.1